MKKIVMMLFLAAMTLPLTARAEKIVNHNVSVRENAGAFYPVLIILSAGDEVEIIEDGPRWKKVRTAGKVTGWISGNAFNPAKTALDYGAMAADTSSRGVSQIMVTAAVKGFFENRIDDPGLNKDLFRRPYQKYIVPSDYARFKKETYKGRWTQQKFRRKNPIEQIGAFTIDDTLVALSAYIVARLTAPGLSRNPYQVVYVNHVAQLIVEATEFYDLPVSVHVVKTDRIYANATPIGVFVISEGMLNLIETESELACLIGHEMSHVTLGHGATEMEIRKPVITAEKAFAEMDADLGVDDVETELNELYMTMYERAVMGRKFEYEAQADHRGMIYARRAGYPAEGMLSLLKCLKEEMTKNKNLDKASHWQPFTIDKRIKTIEALLKTTLTPDRHYADFRPRYQRKMF